MAERIPYAEIEKKWQARWEKEGLFKAPETPRPDKKFYCLDMFPYPSADGLHVGHPEGYTATDILCRYKRMRDFDVLHPMGWDAFGLPAENYAIQTGIHPRITTQKNIANFKRQIRSLGFSYDWDRELSTTDPEYYRWTQWIFLKIFEKGLAYEGVVPIYWCPSCKTGLANEEVFGGACERCGTLTERREIRQWLLKITAYAERLLSDLEALDWPESTLAMQRNWIGRSEGAEIYFPVEGLPDKLSVFTTRPDTLYGATYMVLAPEHPLVAQVTVPQCKAEVERYVRETKRKSEMERTELAKEKTGVFTGGHALHPLTGEKVPVWIADYVLMAYGTGAIMAVPAHDDRDWEFAGKFKLPIRRVVLPAVGEAPEDRAFTENGVAVNSPAIQGLPTSEAKEKMTRHLEENGLGRRSVSYRLRDWVFSRQRYWGEPIPIVHCGPCGVVPVPERDLPVLLPEVERYLPTGTAESPLAGVQEWVNTRCPKCGGPAKRETNTMPQWAGSCWYYLRFIDTRNTEEPWSRKKADSWLPVDAYVGGSEHAVLHLLYARFWHKVLYDLELVSTKEPFQKLTHQGMILAYSYRDSRGAYHPYDQIEFGEKGEGQLKKTGEKLTSLVEKMSKSKKNVINPDEILKSYGADCFRLYEMFMGPLEDAKPWDILGIEGASRFLRRVWTWLAPAPALTEGEGLGHARHRAIHKVTGDIEGMRFNTAISALMIYLNEIQKGRPSLEDAETFLHLLHPFAPHLTEELWERLGRSDCLARREWPKADPRHLAEVVVEVVVQVNGRVRERLKVETGSPEERVRRLALELPKVKEATLNRRILRVVVVPNRLVNVVVDGG